MVADPPIGAVISPEVLGKGRIAYQYTATATNNAKTAMLMFATRSKRFSTHRFYSVLQPTRVTSAVLFALTS